MRISFTDAAEGVQDLLAWERQRIELMTWLAIRGQVAPAPAVAFAGWRERLVRVQAAHQIIAVLIPHEAEIRALDHRLQGEIRPTAPLRASWAS